MKKNIVSNLFAVAIVIRTSSGQLVIAAERGAAERGAAEHADDGTRQTTQPIHIRKDLIRFKNLTQSHTVIVGGNTFRQIGALPGRDTIVLTRSGRGLRPSGRTVFHSDVSTVLKYVDAHPERLFYVIGGGEIYSLFSEYISKWYITEAVTNKKLVQPVVTIDLSDDFKLVGYSETTLDEGSGPRTPNRRFDEGSGAKYTFLEYRREPPCRLARHDTERGYLSLVESVITQGTLKSDRTNVGTMSKFGALLEFDIGFTVPLLTTKRVAWKSCIEELLWFLRGDTDAKVLQRKGVKIWDGNSSREFLNSRGLWHYPDGVIGPGYGWSWRHFGADYNPDYADSSKAKYDCGIDQIDDVIKEIISNPNSRRLYVSAWNPMNTSECALPPCHVSFQFNVRETDTRGLPGYLDIKFDMRSNDLFCGLPFNLFSYAVLCYIIAMKTGLRPGKLVYTCGDAHVYKSHIEQIHTQLTRAPRPFPALRINKCVATQRWEDISIDSFELVGYFPHSVIKGAMAV